MVEEGEVPPGSLPPLVATDWLRFASKRVVSLRMLASVASCWLGLAEREFWGHSGHGESIASPSWTSSVRRGG